MVDRADDMIISDGYNIWPSELEQVIAHHSEIVEVAVFGVPHAKWGEAPLELCVVRPGHQVTETQTIDLVSAELGSYKKPTQVVFQTEPLTRSPVGKIMRKAMREPYWANHQTRVAGS